MQFEIINAIISILLHILHLLFISRHFLSFGESIIMIKELKNKPQSIQAPAKLKIAMIGHKRIPSREGGVEIVVEELSARLINQGHTVVAYNRKGHHVSGRKYDSCGNNEKESSYKGIKIVNVPTVIHSGIDALTSSFFATFISLFGHYDAIHYHAEGPSAFLWLPRLFGIRTVVTIHGLDWQRAKWGRIASGYLKLGERTAAKYADEIIVLSRNTQKYFRDVYKRETVFIPNGIEKPLLRDAFRIRALWGLEKNGYILFLGRIVPEKGLHYLIEAFKQLDTSKKLVIAGGVSGTAGYAEMVKAQAAGDHRILFTDFVQGRFLEELYSNAWAYVLPSDLEGMPISLLEAMSYGNCCLVSDIPECAEVVEDKALLFRRGDVRDLTEKLDLICRDKKTVFRYKRSAADYITGKYNWDETAAMTEKLYESKSVPL